MRRSCPRSVRGTPDILLSKVARIEGRELLLDIADAGSAVEGTPLDKLGCDFGRGPEIEEGGRLEGLITSGQVDAGKGDPSEHGGDRQKAP